MPTVFGVATGQIIVDGDDVNALAGNRIEVGRQGGDQGLAFTGTHFGDLPVVQDHAADQLDIEVAHAEHPLARLTDDSKSLRQKIVERFSGTITRAELVRLRLQLRVGKRRDLRFKRVDALDGLRILLDQPVIAAAENLFE